MSADIDSIKRKLLIKYPTFGSIIANLEFQANKDVGTAGTNGKVVLYNPNFLNGLSDKEQIFLFAHEISHVAFEHIFRSEGKDKKLWNIATDAVINALLQQEGLPMIEGGVDIPEAVNYDAEEMYNKLLEEKKKQEQQNSQGQQEQKNSQDQQEQKNSQGQQEQQNSQGQQEQQNSQGQQGEQKEPDVGHDTHGLWEKAIEERKKELEEQAKQNKQENTQITDKDKKEEQNPEKKEDKFSEQGEQETFKQNRIERQKQLQELSKELAKQSVQGAGTEIQRQGRKLSDIGIAQPLIDWRKLLRQAVKYEEEYTRKNARMRNGYFRHRVEQIAVPETEILLDVSGSVSEVLLKNFLRECKNILDNSKVKVGCFNTEFHGFTELRRPEDIDNMEFPIGGGTDFDVAVQAFSRKVENKIIFTDGEAPMPRDMLKSAIWVVFGEKEIKPKGGKVIQIKGEQLKKLYRYVQEHDLEEIGK